MDRDLRDLVDILPDSINQKHDDFRKKTFINKNVRIFLISGYFFKIQKDDICIIQDNKEMKLTNENLELLYNTMHNILEKEYLPKHNTSFIQFIDEFSSILPNITRFEAKELMKKYSQNFFQYEGRENQKIYMIGSFKLTQNNNDISCSIRFPYGLYMQFTNKINRKLTQILKEKLMNKFVIPFNNFSLYLMENLPELNEITGSCYGQNDALYSLGDLKILRNMQYSYSYLKAGKMIHPDDFEFIIQSCSPKIPNFK